MTADTSISVVHIRREMQNIRTKLLRPREISPSEVRILKNSWQSNLSLMGSLQMEEQALSAQKNNTNDDDSSSMHSFSIHSPSTSSPLSQPDKLAQPEPPPLHMSCLTVHNLREMGITSSKSMYFLTQMVERLNLDAKDKKRKRHKPSKRQPSARERKRSAHGRDEAANISESHILCHSCDQREQSILHTSLTACLFGLQKKLISFYTKRATKPSSWDERQSMDIVRVVLCHMMLRFV